MKINLGAGNTRYDGYINCDYSNMFNPEYVFDLEKDKFPFEDNSVDEVIAHHVLEHLGDGYFHCLQEMYRVCKNGAIVDVRVPHHRSDWQFHDPTHRRTVTEFGLKLFNQEFNQQDNSSASKLGYQYGVDFRIIHSEEVLWQDYPEYDRLRNLDKQSLYQYTLDKWNVYGEAHIKMIVVKP